MKNLIVIIKTIVISLVSALALASIIQKAEATEEFKTMQLTCYTAKDGAVTASGTKPHRGICAVSKDKLGYTAIVYCDDVLVGIYECLDTGFGGDSDGDGVGSIQEGKVIDIYCETMDEAREMMRLYGGKKLKVQFVWANG